MTIDKKQLFGTQGFRMRRSNPDGTIPTATRMLGTSGGIDVDSLAGTEVIKYKADNADETSEVVDITGGTYVDNKNATVDELVTALNAAMSTTNLTFSKDTDTGRLKAAVTSGTPVYVQIYGNLISYLGFGEVSGKDNLLTGIGLKIVKAFDSTKSIGLPNNIRDKEEIENETADGTLTSVIVNAIIKGKTPVLTVAKNDFEAKQLIEGGVFDETADTYEPPTIEQQKDAPVFSIEVFSPVYSEGSNLRTNIAGYEKKLLRKCSGYEGDQTKETKTWTDIVFNLDAVEYTDENGDKSAAVGDAGLTIAEFALLDVENV